LGSISYFADQNFVLVPVRQVTAGVTTNFGTLIFQPTPQNGLELRTIISQDSEPLTAYVQSGTLDLISKQSVLQVTSVQPNGTTKEVRLYDNPRSVQTSTLDATTGVQYQGPLLSFTLTNPTGLTVSVQWTDRLQTPGQIVSEGGQRYSVVGQGVFNQPGAFFATVSFSRDGVPAGSFNVLVQVTNDPQIDGFLTRIYSSFLGRSIEPAAVSYWVSQLNLGVTRASVVTDILASPESQSVRIIGLYRHWLGRTPGDSEVAYWLNFVKSEHDLSQVQQGLIGSPEFFGKSGGNPHDFLFAIYGMFLDRVPDSPSLAAWEAALQSGWSTSTVVNAIATSQEAAIHQVYTDFLSYLKRLPESGAVVYFSNAKVSGDSSDSVAATILGSDEFFHAA
jgi:hypothetical protein